MFVINRSEVQMCAKIRWTCIFSIFQRQKNRWGWAWEPSNHFPGLTATNTVSLPIPCVDLMCVSNLLLLWKRLSHIEQGCFNVLWSECFKAMWTFNELLFLYALPHSVHIKSFEPEMPDIIHCSWASWGFTDCLQELMLQEENFVN